MYGVYIFVLLFCIVQAYIVESMQITQHKRKQGLDPLTVSINEALSKGGHIGYPAAKGGRSPELDAQIEELKKILDDAYKALKKGPQNHAQIGYPQTRSNSANSEVYYNHNLQVNLVDSLPPNNTGKTYNLTKSQLKQCRKIERAYKALTKGGTLPSQRTIATKAGMSDNTARKYIKMMNLPTAGKSASN